MTPGFGAIGEHNSLSEVPPFIQQEPRTDRMIYVDTRESMNLWNGWTGLMNETMNLIVRWGGGR